MGRVLPDLTGPLRIFRPMNWGNAVRTASRGGTGDVRGGTGDVWDGSTMTAAAAACAAQLPVAGFLAYVLSLDNDDYGAGGGPYLGLACAIVFAPLLLPLAGVVHSALQTLPAMALGRLADRWRWRRPRRGGGRERAWSLGLALAAQVPVGAAWAAFFALLGGPFVALTLGAAASGVVPVLAVAYWRRQGERLGGMPRRRRIWLRSALASVVVGVAVVGLAVLATVTGLIKEYEPPQPSPRQLAGTWLSDDGKTAFTLGDDGRAVVPRARGECGGAGTWTVSTDEPMNGAPPRPTVVIEVDGCEGARSWMIGGTEDDLELFVVNGDMDAPDVEKLHRG
ncbi:putative integral membrane protein [Streptomyces formicae]|uniref:Putative integral membrane protein n=2 Tax=Streptomyces formicae TaxID=1616117 RepID=A0A291QAQ7_9ACTN|nr:putative integral membrane protein [Streptomyces formicae]